MVKLKNSERGVLGNGQKGFEKGVLRMAQTHTPFSSDNPPFEIEADVGEQPYLLNSSGRPD